jgi:hypothetical protein
MKTRLDGWLRCEFVLPPDGRVRSGLDDFRPQCADREAVMLPQAQVATGGSMHVQPSTGRQADRRWKKPAREHLETRRNAAMDSVACPLQHDRPIRLANFHEPVPSTTVRTDAVDTEVVDTRLNIIERDLDVTSDALPPVRLLTFEGTIL